MAKFLDVKFNVNTNGLRNKLRRKRSLIDTIPKEAYKYFVKITPIDSGNAKRKTFLRGNTIHADYAYAYRLDKESWSKQAIKGMTIPTIEFIKKLYKKLMRIK